MTIRFLRRRHTLRLGDGRLTLRLATRAAAANSPVSRLPYLEIWPEQLSLALSSSHGDR